MLTAKQAKTITKIRLFLGIMSFGLLAAFVTVQVTSLRLIFVSDNLVLALQGMVSVLALYCIVFGIPWKKLIALKVVNNQPDMAIRLRAVPRLVPTSVKIENGERPPEERGRDQPEMGLQNPAADAI